MKLFSKLSISFSLVVALFFLTLNNAFACTLGLSPTSATGNTNVTETISIHNSDGDFVNGFDVTSSNPTMSNLGCSGNPWCSDTGPYQTSIISSTHIHYQDDGGDIGNVITSGGDMSGWTFRFNGNLSTTFTLHPAKDGTPYGDTCTATVTCSGGTCTAPTPTPTSAVVLGDYSVNPTDAAAIGSMTTSSTSSFLSLFEANWPSIISLAVTLIVFFAIWRLVKIMLKNRYH